ncbi:hypothetical protein OAA19_01500 [Rubripirellula sp.]|nr:hypothetical protein [Rubripirellula sp.]MDB4338762.1 hypothetical protein [Rubripirellula sp.]
MKNRFVNRLPDWLQGGGPNFFVSAHFKLSDKRNDPEILTRGIPYPGGLKAALIEIVEP